MPKEASGEALLVKAVELLEQAAKLKEGEYQTFLELLHDEVSSRLGVLDEEEDDDLGKQG